MYATLFYKAQRELSVVDEVSIAKLLTGSNKREEFERLKAFFKSDVAVGKAPDEKAVAMLKELYATELSDSLKFKHVDHDAQADRLAILEQYYHDKQERWTEMGKTHYLSFLFNNYHERVYWFEWVEVNRRILLSGVLVLFGSGSTVQSAFSILICLASITLYSIYVPLKDDADNFLQWITQMQLFLVLLTILLMKVDSAEDSSADQTYLGWLLIAMTFPGYLVMVWTVVIDSQSVADDMEEVLVKEVELVNEDDDGEEEGLQMVLTPQQIGVEVEGSAALQEGEPPARARGFLNFLESGGEGFTQLFSPTNEDAAAVAPAPASASASASFGEPEEINFGLCSDGEIVKRESSIPPDGMDGPDGMEGDLGLPVVPYTSTSSSGGRAAREARL